MNHSDLTAKDVPSLESVYEVKLKALLNDLVRREGKIREARSLGVNYKMVARSIESGRLSVRLLDALTRRLLNPEETVSDGREDTAAPEQPARSVLLGLLGDGYHTDALASEHGVEGDGVLTLSGEAAEFPDEDDLEGGLRLVALLDHLPELGPVGDSAAVGLIHILAAYEVAVGPVVLFIAP